MSLKVGIAKYEVPFGNQTWLAGKSPNQIRRFIEKIIELNGRFSSKPGLITGRGSYHRISIPETLFFLGTTITYYVYPSLGIGQNLRVLEFWASEFTIRFGLPTFRLTPIYGKNTCYPSSTHSQSLPSSTVDANPSQKCLAGSGCFWMPKHPKLVKSENQQEPTISEIKSNSIIIIVIAEYTSIHWLF